MIFEAGRPTHYDFYTYNKRIEIVESFKYLGIQLYKKRKLEPYAKTHCTACNIFAT